MEKPHTALIEVLKKPLAMVSAVGVLAAGALIERPINAFAQDPTPTPPAEPCATGWQYSGDVESQTWTCADETPAPDESAPPTAEEPKHHNQAHRSPNTPQPHRFVNYEMANWSKTEGNGCYSTAVAMIVSSETGKRVTPNTIAASKKLKPFWSHATGVHGFLPNSLHGIAHHYGLKEKREGFKEAIRTLEAGGRVLLLANPGHFAGPAGHFMVGKEAKNGRIIIADPNGKGRSGDSERARGWSGRELRNLGVAAYWGVKPKAG